MNWLTNTPFFTKGMYSVMFKFCLILLVSFMAYLQFGKENLKIGVLVIVLIALISIIVDIINYKDKLKSDLEIEKLTIKLNASGEIQNSQLSELKSLRHETTLLQDIGHTQLAATFYTEELNQKIGKVFFRIKLNKRMFFQDLCPFYFLFEIKTISNEKIKCRYLIENGNVIENSGQQLMLESYSVYHVEDNGKCLGGQVLGHITTEIENIAVEFGYPLDAGLLKDFHDEKLNIWLPENILTQASFIEFVVNGWAILHRNIDKFDWSKFDKSHMAIMWPEFKFDKLELYENWKENKSLQPYAGWRIDLYNNIPTKHSAGSSRWAGF